MPTLPVPDTLNFPYLYRFTLDQYRKMIEAGIIEEGTPCELLEGLLPNQPRPVSPPVASAKTSLNYAFHDINFVGWYFRCALAIPIPESASEPEPDFAVVKGELADHYRRFPGPAEVGIVGEVCDSSLHFDRREKGRIYSAAGIPVYWVVNVIDRQIEVYTNPQPAATPPEYATRTVYPHGGSVPVVLDGVTVAALAVADLIP